MSICQAKLRATTDATPACAPDTARPLVAAEQMEVLAFLAARPVHTVALASAIRDHGLISPQHRGRFYGFRDETGRLEGVALVGHATLVAAATDRALAAFARIARQTSNTHMILGERQQVAKFWQHYSVVGNANLRCAARELLYTLGFPLPTYEPVATLREANRADLELILPIQAELARAESGVDPRTVDPAGFYARCERRVARGRTWAVVEHGRLLFKAEMQAVTPEAIYLEGIYAHPDVRGRGLGVHCLSHLCRKLLRRTDTLCLLVNEQNHAAQQLYRRVGFRAQGSYDTIFLSNDC